MGCLDDLEAHFFDEGMELNILLRELVLASCSIFLIEVHSTREGFLGNFRVLEV